MNSRIISYIFLVFALASTNIFAQKILEIPKVSPELLQDADRVLLEEFIETEITSIDKMTIKSKKVWMVLNANGDRQTSLQEYYDGNSNVKKIEVQFYDMDGRRYKRLKKKDFHDVAHSDGSLYREDRKLIVGYTPTFYPYIAVFESEVESGDTAFIRSWFPLESNAQSTLHSTYIIKFDPSNKVRYKALNMDGFDVTIDETPNEIRFSAKNVMAKTYEEMGPEFSQIYPMAFLAMDRFMLKGKQGNASSWNEFGKWVNDQLLSDVGEISEFTVNRMRNLVANETTNEAKARKIYQYLQEKVRYINVYIGIGGWKPMTAKEVDRLSYGDCKALTNYTKALLDAVGIPSYYTLLYSGNGGTSQNIMRDFVSIQGNHAILGIPDGDQITWLECTSQDVPYGFIGLANEDRDVLLITPEGGEIVRSKIYSDGENLQQTSINLVVDDSGKIDAQVKRISEGLQYGSKYKLDNLNSVQRERYYKERLNNGNNFDLSDIKVENNREDISFTEEFTLKSTSYLKTVSEGYILNPNIFNHMLSVPPPIENRSRPLQINYGYTDIDSVGISLPKDFQVNTLFEKVVLNEEFGSYEAGINKSSNGELVYYRNLIVRKGRYAASEYEKYRNFLRTVARMDKRTILLKRL